MDNTKKITEDFRRACDALAEAVNRQLFDGERSHCWVADEHGGLCDYGDTDFLSPGDMVLILERGVDYGRYSEWCDANAEGGQYINLRSWLMGCRHHMLKGKGEEE